MSRRFCVWASVQVCSVYLRALRGPLQRSGARSTRTLSTSSGVVYDLLSFLSCMWTRNGEWMWFLLGMVREGWLDTDRCCVGYACAVTISCSKFSVWLHGALLGIFYVMIKYNILATLVLRLRICFGASFTLQLARAPWRSAGFIVIWAHFHNYLGEHWCGPRVSMSVARRWLGRKIIIISWTQRQQFWQPTCEPQIIQGSLAQVFALWLSFSCAETKLNQRNRVRNLEALAMSGINACSLVFKHVFAPIVWILV